MTNPILPGETNIPPSPAPVSEGGAPFSAGWYAFARSLWIRTGGRPGPDNQVAVEIIGKPLAGYFYLRSIPIGIYFPRNFEGSTAFVSTFATADAVFSVYRQSPIIGAVLIGTVTIPLGIDRFAFVGSATATRLDPGDAVLIQAPNPQDATLSDVSITLLARKI